MGFRQFSRSDRSQSCHRPVGLWLLNLQSLHAKAKGATNIFSSIFIFKTSFIYPSYLYFIMPARGHKCCERLVNPVHKNNQN